jgi:DNA-binding NtrC family response regulator
MASANTSENTRHASQPEWFSTVVELLRLRGHLTLSVKIGYEFVLIVSGSTGEAAVIDLSSEPTSLWTDAWTGMRQVLPRVPVVAIVPEGGADDPAIAGQVAVTSVTSPVDPEELVAVIERILEHPSYTR